jgi:FAD:protein FMN transferase
MQKRSQAMATVSAERATFTSTRIEPACWPVHEFRAMGSSMSVRLALPAHEAVQHFSRVVAHFAEAERRFSRFDPQSELSEVNRRAGGWQAVSPPLWGLLATALEMAAATGGLFDPTMLVAIESAGYTRTFAELAGLAKVAELADRAIFSSEEQRPSRGNWQAIRRRPATHEIYLPPGTGLDFGGIAKGVVAAEVVEWLREVGPCLIDAGGDLVAGAAPPGWPGWPVAIAAPQGAGEIAAGVEQKDLALVWLAEAALATSGTDYRRWQHRGQVMHHILDPRSGEPAQSDLVTVTVMAGRAAQAEAWAKAALILGLHAGVAALDAEPLGALLVHQDGTVVMTPALQAYVVSQSFLK